MFRSLFTLALSLFLLAEASAQTAPAATTRKATVKSSKATARATRRAAKKAQKVAAKPAPAVADDWATEWPPVEAAQPVVASAEMPATDVYAGATESRGEIDNANVYAAPGRPVHVRTSKEMAPYSVRPPRKAASTQTTLGTGN